MLMRLELETRSYHADADRTWIELLDRYVTPADYAARLVRVFGFEAPLEAALAYTPHLTTLVELRPRFRSGLIAHDLIALGRRPSEVATLPQCMIAPFRGIAEALGWLYVMERATLLHGAVHRRLVAHLELAPACAYVTAYEGVVGARWEELGRMLDSFGRAAPVQQQIITAARDAFTCAIDWHQGAVPRRARA